MTGDEQTISLPSAETKIKARPGGKEGVAADFENVFDNLAIAEKLPDVKRKYSRARFDHSHVSRVVTHSDSLNNHHPLTPKTIVEVKAETVRVLSRMSPRIIEEHGAKPLDWKSFVICHGRVSILMLQDRFPHIRNCQKS
jgi:hypothetical protein